MIPGVLHSDKMYGEKDRKHQPCSCDPTLSFFLSVVKCKMKEIVLLLGFLSQGASYPHHWMTENQSNSTKATRISNTTSFGEASARYWHNPSIAGNSSSYTLFTSTPADFHNELDSSRRKMWEFGVLLSACWEGGKSQGGMGGKFGSRKGSSSSFMGIRPSALKWTRWNITERKCTGEQKRQYLFMLYLSAMSCAKHPTHPRNQIKMLSKYRKLYIQMHRKLSGGKKYYIHTFLHTKFVGRFSMYRPVQVVQAPVTQLWLKCNDYTDNLPWKILYPKNKMEKIKGPHIKPKIGHSDAATYEHQNLSGETIRTLTCTWISNLSGFPMDRPVQVVQADNLPWSLWIKWRKLRVHTYGREANI